MVMFRTLSAVQQNYELLVGTCVALMQAITLTAHAPSHIAGPSRSVSQFTLYGIMKGMFCASIRIIFFQVG